jgi:FAD/FMN-containing dehydrogenase
MGDFKFRPADAPRASGEPFILPPKTDLPKFRAFLARVESIVDEANVQIIDSEDDISKEKYMDPSKAHDMFHILEKTHFISSAVVAPKNVADVQEIMKLANEYEVPVWPFSKGRNVGYGGAAPRVPGSVGIDMGRHMNKVLEVNAESAYALVEPGVSFFDLHEYLVKHNLRDKVWADVPDLGGGSVIGNTLERGVGYTPYGDHW